MGLRINTNVAALNAQRQLGGKKRELDNSLERLSSGQRINKASDDAAGLAISENLKAQIRSTRQAVRNSYDGVSMIQTAEGGLNEVGGILIRMRELSMQAASDTIGDKERSFLDKEFQQVKQEINRIAEVTEFNGRKLLDGSGTMLEFQIGTRNSAGQDRITYNSAANSSKLSELGIEDQDIVSKSVAQNVLVKLDGAIDKINSNRANLGALQNRLLSTINNSENYNENITAANSRIRDTDVASESANLVANNIMVQAATSVLTQANQTTSMAIRLLQ